MMGWVSSSALQAEKWTRGGAQSQITSMQGESLVPNAGTSEPLGNHHAHNNWIPSRGCAFMLGAV
eukprot:3542870-Amphidinium_carterae.1